MRRLPIFLAVLALLVGGLSAKRTEEENRFHLAPVQVLSAVEANYPITSVTWGTVVLQATIGKRGEIENIKVVRDIPPFTQEAERTLRLWKFKPATLDGIPVSTTMAVAFSFNPRPGGR